MDKAERDQWFEAIANHHSIPLRTPTGMTKEAAVKQGFLASSFSAFPFLFFPSFLLPCPCFLGCLLGSRGKGFGEL